MIAGSLNGTNLYFATSSNGITIGNLTQGIGMTLVSVTSTIGTNIKCVACDTTGQYVVCANSSNSIFYSNNYGTSWSASSPTSITGAYTITCIGNGSSCSFIIGDNGNNIWLSTNQGQLFTSIYTGSQFNSGFNDSIGYIGTTMLIGTLAGYPIVRGIYTPPPPPPPPVICFKEGSKILCLIDEQELYVPIETIKPGTLVKTRLDGYKPVALIGTSKLYNPNDNLRGSRRLYKLTQEKYPELTEDLFLTGCHCILKDNITWKEHDDIKCFMKDIYKTDEKIRIPACLDERAIPYQVEGVFPIWHLALEHEDMYMNYGIYANGLLVESTSKRMISEYSGMKLIEN